MISKKDILNARQGDPKAFLDTVRAFLEERQSVDRFSAQDSTKISLGAAMSVVDKVPDPKKTRELLGVVRDWIMGRVSDSDVERVEKELWELYEPVRFPGTASAAMAASSMYGGGDRPSWAIYDVLAAGACPQDIIDSIEKETGPLDWFLASRGM